MASQSVSESVLAFQWLTSLMLDSLRTEVCLVQHDGTILIVNEAWRTFARENEGDPARLSEGANYLAVCDSAVGPKGEMARVFGRAIRAVLAGERDSFDMEYGCPGLERERWFKACVTAARFQDKIFAVITHQETTEAKRADEALFDSLQRLQGIWDSVPDIMYELDLQGHLLHWNKSAEQRGGYKAEELQGRSVLEFFVPEDRERIAEAMKRMAANGMMEEEGRVVSKDGRVTPYAWAGSALRDKDGVPYAFTTIGRDIDERVKLEKQLRLQYEQLKELDRLKSNFVNSVTHELRTPLTSIVGYAEFLEDEIGGCLSPQQHGFVQELQRSARRLETLLNDLLDFARLDAGTFRIAIAEADLGPKILECVESLRPQAKEAKIDLVVELPERPLRAPMDQGRIGQVLLNLVGNAIKFTPPGGMITVRARHEGGDIRCEVVDTGIGVSEEDLPKLFQRFTQLTPGVKRGKGAGLGLSISKSIIDAHGGRLGVESREKEGSVFWFSLPTHSSLPPLDAVKQ